jgi:hypothetical protein
MRSAGASVAALALLSFWTRLGGADDIPAAPPTTARLEVHGPAECTSKEFLATRVQARAPRIRFAEDGVAWTVRVTVSAPQPGRVVAELARTGPDAQTSSRRLVARSCDEASDGAALIIAVTLDPSTVSDGEGSAGGERPSANTRPQGEEAPHTTPSATPTANPPAPPTPTNSASSPAPPRSQPVADAPPGSGPDGADSTSTSPRAGARWHFGADVAAQSFLGVAPGIMPGVTVAFVAAFDRDGPWSPALFLGGTHAWTTGLIEPGGTAAFLFDAGSIDACFLRAHGSIVAARACASALVGQLTASGSGTLNPATSARPFAVAGVSAIVAVHVAGPFELSARLGAGATLVRDSFEFTPVVFYGVAPVTLSGDVGLGVRWP